MSLIHAWVIFPIVFAGLGWGWGVLIEQACGKRLPDALLIPIGLAAALVLAGTITTFPAIAPATVIVVTVGAVAGIALAIRNKRGIGIWPLLAAVGVMLVFGAPVILSGQATFAGMIKLDDTATWLNIIDNVISHGRSVAGLPASTYKLNFEQANPSYPLGAFMLPGLTHSISFLDMAWAFQPYLACCAGALAMVLYGMVEMLISSPRLRALAAFIAAQAALLYAYAQWSGIKELTAALLLALGIVLVVKAMDDGPIPVRRWRELIPLALAAGALMQTLSIGAGGWMLPAMLLLIGGWVKRAKVRAGVAQIVGSIAILAALTATFVVPIWAVLASFLSNDSSLFSEGQSVHTKLGNLFGPLKVFQLAGIWPVGDFRLTAPLTATAILIALELICALGALWWAFRRGSLGVGAYVLIALCGCLIFYLGGATPWVIAKAFAICSPAILLAAMAGALSLIQDRKGLKLPLRRMAPVLGSLAALAVGGGVIWSNVLAYGDVSLASRPRMAEFEHIEGLVNGKGPTFINEYEVYADRHFLRDGAPVEPAEYRPVTLPLRNGKILTKAAWADLNSFPLSTLLPYQSIVTRRAPNESRPPSIYKLIWQGRFYQLWQRPNPAPQTILEQVPYGESTSKAYCGAASNGPIEPICSVDPVTIPSCPQVRELAAQAQSSNAHLVAYIKPRPVSIYGDEVRWPSTWYHEEASHTLFPEATGAAEGEIVVPSSQHYEVFLSGEFGRGFEVEVDGHLIGSLVDELSGFNAYSPVGVVYLTKGVHKFRYIYPAPSLAPGSAENSLTSLSDVALMPLESPREAMLSLAPSEATKLCSQYVNWIEIVAGKTT